jgi:precorrin-6B methylase 2
MAEFRSTLNLASAVRTVEARKEQIERARAEEERRAIAAEDEKKRVSDLREAAKAYEAVSAPVINKTAENEPVAAEKRYKAAFTVIGTKKEILEVKKFLEERGITYES